MREVVLGELLTPAQDTVRLVPDAEYATVGILSYGRGLFERPIKRGRDISYSTYYRLRAGQFVYSRLFAWEGALAVVPDRFDQFHVSQEFPVFEIERTEVLPQYLSLLCQRPELWAVLAAAVSGMGGRRMRVHPPALLSTPVLLPSLPEQRRIVDLVEAVDSSVAQAERLVASARRSRSSLLAGMFDGLDDAVTASLGDVAIVNPKGPQLAPTSPFVPMDAVEPDARWPRYYTERGDRNGARARAGDTIFARITPCLENGKVAQIPAAVDAVGGSTEFIVIRAGPALDPDYLYLWATADHVRQQATNLMSGTTGRQRLAASDLASLPISVPSVTEQRRIVDLVLSMDVMTTAVNGQVQSARRLRAGLIGDLLSGNHELPDSYDRFLNGAA
jgi:type I restriction enzyme S subunit